MAWVSALDSSPLMQPKCLALDLHWVDTRHLALCIAMGAEVLATAVNVWTLQPWLCCNQVSCLWPRSLLSSSIHGTAASKMASKTSTVSDPHCSPSISIIPGSAGMPTFVPSVEYKGIQCFLWVGSWDCQLVILSSSWQIDGGKMERVADFTFLAPKSLQMVTAARKLKDACSLEEKLCPT